MLANSWRSIVGNVYYGQLQPRRIFTYFNYLAERTRDLSADGFFLAASSVAPIGGFFLAAWRTSELRSSLRVKLHARHGTITHASSESIADEKEFQSHKFVAARDKFNREIRLAKSCDVCHCLWKILHAAFYFCSCYILRLK